MFELRHINGKILKNAMYALKGMFVDVNFDCSVEALFLANYVDTSCRGLMVTLFLKSGCFDHYICDKNTTISMDVPTMISSFKCAGRDASVSIWVDDKEATLILTIAVTTDRVKFSTEHIDWGGTTWTFKRNIDGEADDHVVIEMAQPEVVSSTFSLKYFNSITKAEPLSNRVSICISKDGVIVIEYKVSEMGQMRFYLAPLVSPLVSDDGI